MTDLDRAVAAAEREMLLSADAGLLAYYLDMLADAGDPLEAPLRREWDNYRAILPLKPSDYRVTAAAVGRHGYAHLPRRERLALACLLEHNWPVESAELRLSVASGEWPWRGKEMRPYSYQSLTAAGFAETYRWVNIRSGAVNWKVMAGARGYWRWRQSSDWAFYSTDGKELTVSCRDADVRVAARTWLEELLA